MADVINRAKSVGPAALQKAPLDTNMSPEQLIIDYKGVQFENGQNVLATGVVTQIGWDGEKHTLWPWDLAAKSGVKSVYPTPRWQERDSKPKANLGGCPDMAPTPPTLGAVPGRPSMMRFVHGL